jgi:hypothetical protein
MLSVSPATWNTSGGLPRPKRNRGFSYGFRPGKSQHNALDVLAVGLRQRKVSWVLDADIRGFFDNISHEWMIKFLNRSTYRVDGLDASFRDGSIITPSPGTTHGWNSSARR